MATDERLVEEARAAATRIVRRQADLDGARQDFQRAVRAIYLAGASLREIADSLELSHQRVHQLLNLPIQPRSRRPGRRRRDLPCSFCGRTREQVCRLIHGPNVSICDDCVELASTVDERRASASDGRTTIHPAGSGRCSFCGRRSGESAGPGVTLASADAGTAAICGECLDLCSKILSENPASSPEGSGSGSPSREP